MHSFFCPKISKTVYRVQVSLTFDQVFQFVCLLPVALFTGMEPYENKQYHRTVKYKKQLETH